MKIAIMQPYVFPYIGYFHLINSVEKFVFYDDVAFIKQGWINRNNILINKAPYLFSIPVVNVSSFELINKTEISYKTDWTIKLLKTIDSSYRKAKNFNFIYPLIEQLVMSKPQYVSDFAKRSVQTVLNYLDVKTEIIPSSVQYENSGLKAQTRVIDICKKENASMYINPMGGKDLYSADEFKKSALDLKFIKSVTKEYKQYDHPFVPHLSIIDVLMFNSIEETRPMLESYELL